MKTAIVIGGGIGGLATAIRLTSKGYQVELYEKNAEVGGKVSELQLDGFRFDMGPSLFTMPEYLEDLFKSAGKDLKDYLKYQKLDHSCHYFFSDGSDFIFYDNIDQLAHKNNFEFSHADLADIRSYLSEAKLLFDRSGRLFLEKSLQKTASYFSKQAIKALPQLINPKHLKPLHQKNASHFKNQKLIQLFDRYATYNGSSPYQAPAMLSMISHLEHNIGTFFPEGGMYGIISALVTLAEECGVKIINDAEVQTLETNKGQITAAIINDERKTADIFVSNMDVAFVYKKLLNNNRRFLHETKKERSSSALVFYWGINQSFPNLNLHNIFFAGDYKAEFEAIFKGKEIPVSPTIYLNISSKLKPADAPSGMENWFVMINVPAGDGLSEENIKDTKMVIIKQLSHTLNADIESSIIVEQMLRPQDISNRTFSFKGALYGASSNSLTGSFTRHSNFSKDFSNLYFVGGTVHPGGGIPLCLNSAKIVVDSL